MIADGIVIWLKCTDICVPKEIQSIVRIRPGAGIFQRTYFSSAVCNGIHQCEILVKQFRFFIAFLQISHPSSYNLHTAGQGARIAADFIIICATCALVAVPLGERLFGVRPLIIPFATAQFMAVFA